MKNIQQFSDFLTTASRKLVILTHHKPDADALGSSLGLAAYLKLKGHQVSVWSPSDYPDFLSWMPGNEQVCIFQKTPEVKSHAEASIQQADLIFCLDFSSLSRINELGEMVRRSAAKKALIDHHLEPESFADFEQWDVTAASTAELVYQTIVELGDESLVNAEIASCLYAGVMTDTGSFRHNNTNHKVFEVAGKLVARGANPHTISKLIYDNNSVERVRLMGYVLGTKLQFLPEFRTAYMTLTRDELKDSSTGDTEGLVNFGLSVRGIVLSAMIYERRDGTVKLSFRSLGDFSVNDLARKYFEGGGHRNAAGGQSNDTLEKTLKRFLEVLPEYKDQLNKS
jgi:phosphoesterase RecJ-like protein